MLPDYGWTLPEKITARLGRNSFGRQRSICEDDHLLLILHRPPKRKDAQREGVVFLRKPDGQWLCNGRDDGHRKLMALVRDYADLFTQCDRDYQQAKGADDLFKLIETLTPLKHSATSCLRALQEARETVPQDRDLIEARDQAYENQRNCELLFDLCRDGLDFRIAVKAEEDARAAKAALEAQHRLNILAALFFPLTALTGLFGMDLIRDHYAWGIPAFWGVLAGGLFVGLMFKGWVGGAVSQKKERQLT
jgi:hypothetical protein